MNLFSCMVWGCILTSLMCNSCPIFPTPTVEETVFSSLYFCWRLIDHRCLGLFLGCIFCSLDPYVWFCASTMLFWLLKLYNIVQSLGGLCILLCSFSSGLLWQLGLLLFDINYWITCSSFVKNVMGNLIRISLNL